MRPVATTGCPVVIRVHGTANAYLRLGCRCPAAFLAHETRNARRRTGGRAVDPIAIERRWNGDDRVRLRKGAEIATALAALDDGPGRGGVVAARLGVSRRTVQRHRASRREMSGATA